MRITMPFSFWLAIAVNLPYVDAFTPPSLFSLPGRFGGGESVGNHDRAVRERGRGPFSNVLGDNDRGHQRLQQSRHSPFYFANIPSATSLSAAASSGDGIEINDNRKKHGQAEVARARTRYLDWCSEYRKTPEEKRFHQFVDNFLIMEAMARKQGTQIRLNEFADCTAEEYQKIMSKGVGAGGGPGQSQLNKDLKMVDQTSTTKKKPVPAPTPATSSGTTASTPQNATAPGAGTTTSSTQAAVQQAKAASQQASQAVASAQQKVGGAVSSSTASKPPLATAGKKSSTIIPPDEMGNDDAKLLAQQKEQQRAARKAQAEAAQRAELERARLRKEQEKAQRDAELAAQKAEQEKSKQEAIAAQRRKVEEAERKRRELVARAEAAQRAEAAAAKARREAEEQKRKEEEAAAAAAKAKTEEEERQRKLKEEEERLQRERELAAEKARQKAEALAKKQAEEARLKKEEEEIQAAAEAKRKAEELAAKKAEEARLKKEREDKAAAEAKQKAEELARLKTEQARLKKEQQERVAAEAAKKAEEEARKKAEEKARLKKEQEEKAAAEAKRKQEELERLAKEREILLEKKRQQELEAKRKKDEAVLMKRKQEGENDQKKLVEATNRLVSVLSKEQNVLSAAESKLEADREKAILEHKQKIVEVLKSRAADLEASKLQVSKDTKTLLSTLTDARSYLQELETKLAAGRQKVVAEYQQRRKEMTEAERKQEAELQAQRQREQRELAARRKIEEDKRRQEEILARQKAEEETKKRALEEKRRLEAIAREKRKAEEELRVKNLAAQAEKEAEEKRAREEKRQKEITEKAKAAALAAKKDAKEKKKMEDLKRIEDMKNEDIPKSPVAGKDKPTEKKVSTTIDKQSDNSQVSSVVKDEDKLSDSDPKQETVALSDEEKEKSLDEQLAELTSMIDELQRESDDAEADKSPVEEAKDDTVAEPTKSKDDSLDSSSKHSKDKIGKDASKSTASSSKEAGSEVDGKAKKKDEAEEDLRIRSAYLDWCISYSKKPDMTRIQQFKKNYLLIEEFAKENGKEIKLNDYADCTAAEYERAMKEKEDIKKKEEDEQKKREEEAAASYKAAVDEASQLFGVDGNTTAVAKDDSVGSADGSALTSEDDTITTGDPDDVWKTGEPTMSMWQPEDDGESMWASEGGASVWESRESSEWGEIDESYSALGTVDPDDPEVRRRVRSAYSNWCREYNKETDESRFPRFKTNYLKMEQMAWEQGSEITLNEFADCSPEEYRNAVGLGSSHEEERLERLRREQEAEAEQQGSSRSREDRIERLRREQEEQAARLSAKRTVESVWKVGEPKKRVKDIRVDWDQDETAAIEEVERMALEKAEAAARRVEEARKNKSLRSPASTDPPAFRSNKNDVDRQLRQKAMDERRRRDDGDHFSRNEADERRNVDEEQSKLEEEWAVRSRAKEEDDRLKRQWDREQVQRDVNRQPSTPDFRNPTPKAEPSPAFNLGSIFGIGNNGKASSPPPGNDPAVDPNEPIVKPPGSFEPKVKAPAYDNKAWQDQYIKNYDPTAGGGFRNGGNDSVSKSQLEPPSPSSGDSYFMDLSNGLEDRGRTPEPVPPSNDEWYEDSLSQPRPPHSPADPFSSLEGRSSPNPGGVAPDEAELDATPSRFVQGAESYLGDLSPPPSNGAATSSGYAEKDAAKSFAPPPTPTPEPSASTAASPPRGARSSGSYLDNLQSQFPERIESAYSDWCQYYGKEASEDRLRIFASNFLAVEKYHRETGVSLILNELADMTSDEFQSNPKNGKA